MFGVLLAFVALFLSLLFILFVTVHRETHFLVNVYWDNTYSDSDSSPSSLVTHICLEVTLCEVAMVVGTLNPFTFYLFFFFSLFFIFFAAMIRSEVTACGSPVTTFFFSFNNNNI